MNATGPPSRPDPHATVRQLVTGYWISQSIGVAARLSVADRPADGPRGSDELSRLCGAHPPSLFRLLRPLAGVRLLRQLDDDRFELTSTGQYLRSDVGGSLRRYATFFCGDRQWRAWGRLEHSVATGETAYDEVLGAGLYDHLAEDPDAAEEFNQAMASSIAQSRAAVVEATTPPRCEPWSTWVGGDGTLPAAILAANPQTQGVLFEREAAARRPEHNLVASGLAKRLGMPVGDFLEAVPGGSDAHILPRVIHVWDDERSVRLLERCRRAMGSHARLLVVQRVSRRGTSRSSERWATSTSRCSSEAASAPRRSTGTCWKGRDSSSGAWCRHGRR